MDATDDDNDDDDDADDNDDADHISRSCLLSVPGVPLETVPDRLSHPSENTHNVSLPSQRTFSKHRPANLRVLA